MTMIQILKRKLHLSPYLPTTDTINAEAPEGITVDTVKDFYEQGYDLAVKDVMQQLCHNARVSPEMTVKEFFDTYSETVNDPY